MAKTRISNLLGAALGCHTEITTPQNPVEPVQRASYINANKLITEFKVIVKECDVDYKDVLNYSLTITENKLREIAKVFSATPSELKDESGICKHFYGVAEFVFFIYSVAPRVNTTITLCRVLMTIVSFVKHCFLSRDNKNLLFKYIFENSVFIMQKNSRSDHTQVETLYLLAVLAELGRDYWIDTDILCKIFEIAQTQQGKELPHHLNYFSITALLFYIKDKVRYIEVRTAVSNEITRRFAEPDPDKMRRGEMVLLLFDCISCPYLTDELKRNLLGFCGIDGVRRKDDVINLRQHWFTKWSEFEIESELEAKRGYEVY